MDILGFAILALLISLVAGGMGFTGVAAGAATVSRMLFGVFLLIAIVLFTLFMLGVSLIGAVAN
jgi:uncharacterized membrane protein YtjA (UPF0391 family)